MGTEIEFSYKRNVRNQFLGLKTVHFPLNFLILHPKYSDLEVKQVANTQYDSEFSDLKNWLALDIINAKSQKTMNTGDAWDSKSQVIVGV